jgi:hypothetical protein
MIPTRMLAAGILWLACCLYGCAIIHRSATFFGLDSGFSLERYDGEEVAVLPVVTNPAFPLSDSERRAIRDVLIRNLRQVAQFRPVSRDPPPDQTSSFPYSPQTQSQLGQTIGSPATVGISIPKYEVESSGRKWQITITLTFVDSINPKRQVTATEIYRSDSPTQPLNLSGLEFDFAVLADLQNLSKSLISKQREANTNVNTHGPFALAFLNPKVVSNLGGPSGSATSKAYSTNYESIPIRVFANDDNGLKHVQLLNKTTKQSFVLFNARPFDRGDSYYLDKSVGVPLAEGSNSLVIVVTNLSGKTSSQPLEIERHASVGRPLGFLAVVTSKAAGSSNSARALLDAMKPLTNESDPTFQTLLSDKEANYQEILSIARSSDRALTPIRGLSIVYYAGEIQDTLSGLRLLTDASTFGPEVSGIPLDSILVSIAPRLVFADLCAEDTRHVSDTIKDELSRDSDQKRHRAPLIFSLRRCAESLRTPTADGLLAIRNQPQVGTCHTFGSLLSGMAATPGVASIGSLDSDSNAACIAGASP